MSAGPNCVGVQDGYFWPDASSPYIFDENVTTLEGCCALCISEVQCQRYQVTPAGCSLLDTANATSPFQSTTQAGVGLGKQWLTLASAPSSGAVAIRPPFATHLLT